MSFSEEVNDLQCSICLRRFHDPIILNCGHTFDRSCLQDVIDSNRSFKPPRPIQCPLCNHAFDPDKPFVPNKDVTKIIQCEPTYEWFLIDISSEEQKTNVLTFLKHVFHQRDIFKTNHITFATDDTRIIFNSNINFEQELKIKSLLNLGKILQEICTSLEQQSGLRKIFILTDGLTKHLNVIKINSNIIDQRVIIHIGDKNIKRTRQLADQINFQFGYFNEKILDIYVQHFLTNFLI